MRWLRMRLMVVIGLSVVLQTAGLGRSAEGKADGKYNVLFIMADDLNTALSGYGHPQCKTPNLDRLASKGVMFTRAYCQFPLCGPSRASLMSGRYPKNNGVQGNGRALPASMTTLPSFYRDQGYWTGRVSKIYHMGVPGNIFTGDNGPDHERSWVERYNVSVMETVTPGKAEDLTGPDSTKSYPKERERWKELKNKGGVFRLKEGNHQGGDFVVVEADGGDAAMADGAAANKAVELLRERAKSEKPFFLAVGFVRPHVPLVAPRSAFKDYTAAEMKLAEVPKGDLDDMPAPALRHSNKNRFRMNAEQQKKVLRGYYASITYMDQQVGRLLDELDKLKLREKTIVVFVSDHGYHLGEHTLWQKMCLTEESIRVPCIVSVPGAKKVGVECKQVVELIDLFPTLVALNGFEQPAGLQGKSLVPWLENPESVDAGNDALIQLNSGFGLRTAQWAYMRYPKRRGGAGSFEMLFDMEKDPKQFTNLVSDAKYKKVLDELRQRMDERVKSASKGAKD